VRSVVRPARAAAVLAVATSILVGPAVVHADTTADVEQELYALYLDPVPLFPTTLPKKLRGHDVDVELMHDEDADRYSVTWTLPPKDDGSYRGYIELSRNPKRQTAALLTSVRRRYGKPKRVTVAGRKVWHVCGHRCGYLWNQDGRSYGVFGIYFTGDPKGRKVARDQRALVRALAPAEGTDETEE
jgi:hypothetical protein